MLFDHEIRCQSKIDIERLERQAVLDEAAWSRLMSDYDNLILALG